MLILTLFTINVEFTNNFSVFQYSTPDSHYYGKLEQSIGLWVGAEAKNGTTKVYRVATLYVIRAGHRLTLGIKFVVTDETAKEIVEYLLRNMKIITYN